MNYNANKLLQILKEKKISLVLAESCTGGLLSSLITQVPGASEVFWGSFICYTPQAKISMLDVDNSLLSKYGLVSVETAKAMATGALKKSGSSLAVSITGLAGPDTDGSDIPVGTVCIAIAQNTGEIIAKEFKFTGSREEVRLQACEKVFEILQGIFQK